MLFDSVALFFVNLKHVLECVMPCALPLAAVNRRGCARTRTFRPTVTVAEAAVAGTVFCVSEQLLHCCAVFAISSLSSISGGMPPLSARPQVP